MKKKKIKDELVELLNEKPELKNMDDMAVYWYYIIKKIDDDLKAKGLNRIDYNAAVKKIFLDKNLRKKKKIATYRTIAEYVAKMNKEF